MAKKRTSRESRQEILLKRFSTIAPSDELPRFIGKMRHSFRDPKDKKRDDCKKHVNIIKAPSGKWFFDPGSGDVKGIDVRASQIKEHFRTDPKTGAKTIKVRRHYRVTKNPPKWCGKK